MSRPLSLLMLGPYPIAEARHGGQKRVKAIVNHYRAHGIAVRYAAVYFPGYYPVAGSDDIPISDPAICKRIQDTPDVGDVTSGEALADDPAVRKRVLALLRATHPDIIQFEHVYPYAGYQRLTKHLPRSRPTLILDSHNAESSMKREIFEKSSLPEAEAHRYLAAIGSLEQACAKDMDLILAVSASDAEFYRQLGARAVAVVSNGTDPHQPSEESQRYWKNELEAHGASRCVTFIGSAHPPNLSGLLEFVGDDAAFLPPDTLLVLAGGVTTLFDLDRTVRFGDKGAPAKVLEAGVIDDDRLAGLIAVSDVILLPIGEGGGSNLKTAEALVSRKDIVATSFAFRAFEDYRSRPEVRLADTSSEFRRAILDALAHPRAGAHDGEHAGTPAVLWSHALAPLLPAVAEAYGPGRRRWWRRAPRVPGTM